jgi:hypothetical protein
MRIDCLFYTLAANLASRRRMVKEKQVSWVTRGTTGEMPNDSGLS